MTVPAVGRVVAAKVLTRMLQPRHIAAGLTALDTAARWGAWGAVLLLERVLLLAHETPVASSAKWSLVQAGLLKSAVAGLDQLPAVLAAPPVPARSSVAGAKGRGPVQLLGAGDGSSRPTTAAPSAIPRAVDVDEEMEKLVVVTATLFGWAVDALSNSSGVVVVGDGDRPVVVSDSGPRANVVGSLLKFLPALTPASVTALLRLHSHMWRAVMNVRPVSAQPFALGSRLWHSSPLPMTHDRTTMGRVTVETASKYQVRAWSGSVQPRLCGAAGVFLCVRGQNGVL